MGKVPLLVKPLAAVLLAGGSLVGTPPHRPPIESKWRAILLPVAGSKVRGGALAEARGADSTRLTITIRDAPPNSVLPWHLHAGTCGAPGEVIGSGYPVLHVGPGGTAEAAVTLPIARLESGNHLVQLHGPTGAPISCGELKPIGG